MATKSLNTVHGQCDRGYWVAWAILFKVLFEVHGLQHRAQVVVAVFRKYLTTPSSE